MTALAEMAPGPPMLYDPTAPLSASGNLRRRMAVDRVVRAGATGSALAAIAILVIVLYGVASRGAQALSLDFVVRNPVGYGAGGIFNSLLGTLELVFIGAMVALPIGILTGLYLTEFAGAQSRPARALMLALDMMQGLPTIVTGLFVYGLIVLPMGRTSGFAGAIALSIVMVPLMARSSQEVVLLVPNSLREAADALGVSRWRTVLSVIVPAALSGIATGAILAMARAAGETAPLLVNNPFFNPSTTAVNPLRGVPSVPMFIYTSYDLPDQQAVIRAWGAAFMLVMFILLANVVARVILARSRARRSR